MLDRSVCRTLWSKAETRLGKVRIEDRRENLQDGLLDQSFLDIGNAQQPLAAIRFRDGFTPSRFRPVRPIEELLSKLRPQGTNVLGELLQRDTIGPGGSVVRFHLLPSLLHVFGIYDLLHQIHRE